MKVARALLFLTVLPFAARAGWGDLDREYEADKPWVEVAAQLPAAPRDADLLEFSVSAVAPHRYYVDPASISVGADRVVRYTVVIRAAGGARNVFFEGLRCETAERRLYAVGQPDGSWTRARDPDWRPIGLTSGREYRKALYEDIFCPGDIRVKDGAEAVANLKRAQP